MTKSTITRERLIELFDYFGPIAMPGEVQELARMALAAMDSEPVAGEARFKEERPRWTPCTAEHVSMVLANPEDWPNYEVRYLYAAPQPAPGVPDDGRADFEAWVLEVHDGDISKAQLPDGEDYANAHTRCVWKAWSASRAAMLAAAPHDTPALNSLQSVDSVAGKWIPVSERMPEDRTQVILWDAEIGEATSGHYSHKTQTFYHCGDAIQNEITHWMLPPSAPQEVK